MKKKCRATADGLAIEALDGGTVDAAALERMHKFRVELGLEIRDEWSLEMKKSVVPDARELSEKEMQALMLSALCDAPGSPIPEKTVLTLIRQAEDAFFHASIYRMALLGIINVSLDDQGELSMVLTDEAAKELGPLVARHEEIKMRKSAGRRKA